MSPIWAYNRQFDLVLWQSTVSEKEVLSYLAPLRGEVLQALATSVLAPVIVMMIRALTSWIAAPL